MESKKVDTYWAKIFIAGPQVIAEQVCRKYCLDIGLCVTIDPTKFIYTGGEELGVVIGLLNYPRFPSESKDIMSKARDLAGELLLSLHQRSALIQGEDETIWISIPDLYKQPEQPAA